jgi:membrane-associated phospholipid phosphatase
VPLLALLVPLLLLCAFGLVAWQVTGDGPLARADEHLGGGLLRQDTLSGILADLGNAEIAVPVLVVAAAYVAYRARAADGDAHRARGTWLSRWWAAPVAALVLTAVLPALIVPLKDWIARPGPPVTGADTGYFPSGHAATATVAYGTAALLLWRRARTRVARLALLAACLLLNAAVGLGLVRHGYHWPLDVAGSWLLCGALLWAYALLLRDVGRRPSRS